MEIIATSSYTAVFLELTLAAFLGMFLGVERSIAGKTAGMRTYALVSLGSCLFIIIAKGVVAMYLPYMQLDPLRIVAGVVTGIGFLGAGMIIMRESKVRGLTTAASLWVASGIGMAVGFNLNIIAVFTTVLTLIIFTALWFLEQKIRMFSYDNNFLEPSEDMAENINEDEN